VLDKRQAFLQEDAGPELATIVAEFIATT